MSLPHKVEPYTALAAGYDIVMQHVDYVAWAEYVLDLLAEHMPVARSIVELGCGTGTLALEVQERAHEITDAPGGFDYLATDASAEMVRVAEAKASMAGAAGQLRFAVAEFDELALERPVDVVLLLYDGLNYLVDESRVQALLQAVAGYLLPGGVAVVDQSTPANSINNAAFFSDAGGADAFRYVRRSRYDEEARLHITEFDIEVEGRRYAEEHVQRAYEIDEVRRLIEDSPLQVAAVYDGFSLQPASERTERAHWVLELA